MSDTNITTAVGLSGTAQHLRDVTTIAGERWSLSVTISGWKYSTLVREQAPQTLSGYSDRVGKPVEISVGALMSALPEQIRPSVIAAHREMVEAGRAAVDVATRRLAQREAELSRLPS